MTGHPYVGHGVLMSLMLLFAHPSLGKGNLSEKQLDKHTNITERSLTPTEISGSKRPGAGGVGKPYLGPVGTVVLR